MAAPLLAEVFAGLTLLAVYALIAFEVWHRTTATIVGAGIVLFGFTVLAAYDPAYGVFGFEEAVDHIDVNVILLLMGMMMLVSILEKTGVFQVLAFRMYRLARGSLFRMTIIFSLFTAVTSAFLDNVTTMLLIAPVIIEICLVLEVSPLPVLLPAVLASNMGGAATLIGDPPNIMIGSAADFTFNDFVVNLAPVVAVIVITYLPLAYLLHRRDFRAGIRADPQAIAAVASQYGIKDPRLLRICLSILGAIVLLFLFQRQLHMEPSVAVLAGVAVLLPLSRADIVKVLHEVEWSTLIFFMMLFIIVGAVESVGLLDDIAHQVERLSGGSLVAAVMLVLWVSAFASAIVDNIPFTATMIPVVQGLIDTTFGAEGHVLWWALALGAALGGNGTLIGASANIVTAGLAERAGHPVSFQTFLKVGFPVMLWSMVVCTAYLLVVEL